ncbi:MAG: bifunctional 4-hydroxy-2-oxoglutarate aldolase/2-dehydro-3-deoxy-phosphogluconate aldolase [Lachnospiraceae bacterium]|nr:bifunctional 4-hydroxy-2-oxoglutarate aldolase/2-dehydro-3-deoxy-phosphogluconate aldolase [Lachnospiraceae bacterium]MDY5649413.1 bifunctional 4-hydroxy-2-oxoglutarate aldolase/2-dehydro-3-deoxy-phosphogluconate aldolase [Lachnospiraceae bacterium]
MSQAVLDKILEGKIIAIVRGIPSDKIVSLVDAMLKGGINCVEVTFDQSSEEAKQDTLKSIATIKKEFEGRVYVGAGTVMTVEQVRQAAEAGAEYMISPNADEEVIKETKRLGKVSIPGALTPTEAAFAYKCGADIVKLFPAGVLGVDYIKALKAPLKHIPVTAVGGVNPKNCADFIKAGCVGVGCGGNLVSAKLVNEGRFDEITAVAKEYMEALSNC